MKNLKLFGIIVLTAVMVFTMAACDNSSGGSTTTDLSGLQPGANGSLGNSISISDIQVYDMDFRTGITENIVFTHYRAYNNTNPLLTDAFTAPDVKTVSGKLTLSLGTPTGGTVQSSTFSSQGTVNPTDANVLSIDGFRTGDTGSVFDLYLMKNERTYVQFWYTDKPVTMTAGSPQINMNLSTGWNIVIVTLDNSDDPDPVSIISSNNLDGFKWIKGVSTLGTY